MPLKKLITFLLCYSFTTEIALAKSDIFNVSGYSNFSASLRNQKSNFEQKTISNEAYSNALENNYRVENDTQIYLRAQNEVSETFKYGAIAKAEFNVNSDNQNQEPSLDKAFLFAKTDFAKIEFGNVEAVNQKMKVGPASFARGAGGINGKYLENVNLPVLQNSSLNSSFPAFILLAQSPIGHGGFGKSFYQNNQDNSPNNLNIFNQSSFRGLKDNSFDGLEDATKLSYITSRIEGFEVGVSYTPNAQNSGITSDKYFNYNSVTRFENIFSFGMNYVNNFDNLSLKLSATSEMGDVKNSSLINKNLFSYDVGAVVSYFGFDFGASYGVWDNFLKDYQTSDTPYYYSTGISYGFAGILTSITLLHSNFDDNKFNSISFGLERKLTKNLMTYIEATKFDFTSNKFVGNSLVFDNSGYVFSTGILINF